MAIGVNVHIRVSHRPVRPLTGDAEQMLADIRAYDPASPILLVFSFEDYKQAAHDEIVATLKAHFEKRGGRYDGGRFKSALRQHPDLRTGWKRPR